MAANSNALEWSRFSIPCTSGYSHGNRSVREKPVRVIAYLSLALLAACASTPERDIKMVHRHQTPSDQCHSLDQVEVQAAQRWWHGLAGPGSYEHLARKRLLRAADNAGGNSVRVTAYRAFKADTGGGMRRVEIEGRILNCPANA